VALGAAAVAGCSAILAGLGYGGVQALNALEANELRVFMGGTYNVHWYELGFLLLFVGVGRWLLAAAERRLQPLDRYTGALLMWLAPAVATVVWLPGASYLFIWPFLVGLGALLLQLTVRRQPITRLATLLPAIVGIVITTPAMYLVLVMAGITGVVVLGVLVALLLAVVPLSTGAPPRAPRRMPAVLVAGGGVAVILFVATVTNYDSAHPRQNVVFYSLNADTREAAWVAVGQVHEPWAQSFTGREPASAHLGEHVPVLTAIGLEAATGQAPVLDIPQPEVTVLDDTLSGATRRVRLHIASQRGADQFGVLIVTPGGVLGTSLYGNAITYDAPLSEVMMSGVALPADGFELAVTILPEQPLMVRIADVTPALPAVVGVSLPPRPATVTGMAGGATPDASTVVHRTIHFPAQP
jgi:hypothetical protein